jgi:hypothetical protein
MKVHVVVDMFDGVIDEVIVFDNRADCDDDYTSRETLTEAFSNYEIYQYETELRTAQDPMTERHGYLGITEEDIEFLAERMGYTDAQRQHLMDNREELSDWVAQDIMEEEFGGILETRAHQMLVDKEDE